MRKNTQMHVKPIQSHIQTLTLVHTDQNPHEEGLVGEGPPFGEVLVQLRVGEGNGRGDIMVQDKGENREVGVDRGIPVRGKTELRGGCYKGCVGFQYCCFLLNT